MIGAGRRMKAMKLRIVTSCTLLTMWTVVHAGTREYYVGVVEEEWDYAPGGQDLSSYRSSNGQSTLDQDSDWKTFLEPGPERIGSKYMKALFREFTDGSFSQQKPREKWMGLLGPILLGEQGDVVRVHFKNMAVLTGRNFSLHPHGAQYTKGHEGALYVDGSSEAEQLDTGVGPGQQYTYEWQITAEASPAEADADCLPWTYHSHVSTVKDVNSGLIGILLTCRPGGEVRTAQNLGSHLAILMDVMDENESWYIDYNIRNYLSLPEPQPLDDLKEDEDFQESNKMHSINGRVYGHLEDIDVCVGSNIIWYLVGFGTEIDIHSLSVSGHSFLNNQHRVDAIGLNPVDFETATMQVQTPGKWRIQCSVFDHVKAGMIAFMNARICDGHRNSSVHTMQVQRFRRYYLAIDEVNWNYAPSNNDYFEGQPLLTVGSESEAFFKVDDQHVGGVYRKALFREYEDVTFSTQKSRGPDEEHLGFLGPVLRLEVGDVAVLTLRNNAQHPFSIHPQGASFMKMWEGALYNDSTEGDERRDDLIQPGQVRTTYWFIPDVMGPGPMDPPCIVRMYTSSASDLVRDAYSGLVGPILICRKGVLDANSKQRQVDREFFLLFSVTDENLSWYSDYNFRNIHGDLSSEEFLKSNHMHGINGYVYGNLPGLNLCLNDRAIWHVFSVGTEVDVHSVYFHGQPMTRLDLHRSSTYLLPGYFRTLLMKAENPGQWAVVCQTNEHYLSGSKALFNVSNCGLKVDYNMKFSGRGRHRTFFLQAEEEFWDYAPSGMNVISGENLSDPDLDSYIFTRSDGPYLGKVYKKARYHLYTDASFTTEITRDPADQYLGVLGPVLTMEAYDTITVTFRNNASRPYSVHAQGLYYDKNSEGAPYGTTNGAVMPGETRVYEWSVPVDFAPSEGDPDCINQAYYSAVDHARDTNSGLIGPLVICKPGTLDPNTGARTDVDKSFVLLFEVIDEAMSWYVDDNIQQFGTNSSKDDPEFGESCLMHSINGYVYGNNPPLEMIQNTLIDWHLMSMGNEVDIHSVHFHGNSNYFHENGKHQKDVTQLFPGIFETVRMNATFAGQWLLHCHVHDHLTAGMETIYTIRAAATEAADSLAFDDIGIS